MTNTSRIRIGFFILSAFLLMQTAKVFANDSAKFAKILNITLDKNQSGHVIDLQFDRPFSAKLLKPAYERNFIQLVLKGTKIDAARIIPATMNGSSQFSKIFAYAYTPDTSRVRLIFNSDKAPQGKINIFNSSPKSVRLVIKDASLVSTVAKVEPKAEAKKAPEPLPLSNNAEEKKLLKEVVENTKEIDIHNPDSIKEALAPKEKEAVSGIEKNPAAIAAMQSKPVPETIGRPANLPVTAEAQNKQVGMTAEPSKHFGRMLVALLGVIGLFVGGVLAVKKYSGNLKKLPFGKKERIIQVVATHYLGQKKSISLVKVAGEYMVVGVGNEGLSLISKLGAEANVDKYLEDRFWGGTFEKHLGAYQTDKSIMTEDVASPKKDGGFAEALTKGLMNSFKPKKYDGAMDLDPAQTAKAKVDEDLGINDDYYAASIAASVTGEKVELSKSSLREKLTKLKPLS